LSLTAFTVERYIAICHPMKAKSVCTVKRAMKIILGVWVFALCYSAPWLGLTTTEPINYKGHEIVELCTFKLSRKEYLVWKLCIQMLFRLIVLLGIYHNHDQYLSFFLRLYLKFSFLKMFNIITMLIYYFSINFT